MATPKLFHSKMRVINNDQYLFIPQLLEAFLFCQQEAPLSKWM